MRFISEFELKPPYTLDRPEAHMLSMEVDMARKISESFGWKHVGFTNLNKDYSGERWTFEIEAFPMDKWVEFKKELLAEFEGSYIDVARMEERIEKLESLGKPAIK